MPITHLNDSHRKDSDDKKKIISNEILKDLYRKDNEFDSSNLNQNSNLISQSKLQNVKSLKYSGENLENYDLKNSKTIRNERIFELIKTENTIRTVKIKDIIKESKIIKTIVFNINNQENQGFLKPRAGQFVMIWVPGVNEIPMSISGYDNNYWSVTVKSVGECTREIQNLKIGDFIGVRGPLGNNFQYPNDYKEKKIILIGGGIGIAPLRCLAFELHEKNIPFVLIAGATCSNDSIFTKDFKNLNPNLVEIVYCTDDGSYGSKGVASEVFKDYIQNFSKDEISRFLVYTCGPEKMMYHIFQICEKFKIDIQASLERIMRCGCGICGLCALDPLGLLVCKDGPVFSSNDLRNLEDFGKYKRDLTGKKIPVD